jgi:hypothetical protein
MPSSAAQLPAKAEDNLVDAALLRMYETLESQKNERCVPQRTYEQVRDNNQVNWKERRLVTFREVDGTSLRFSEVLDSNYDRLIGADEKIWFGSSRIGLKIEVANLAILGDTVILIDYTVARLQTP